MSFSVYIAFLFLCDVLFFSLEVLPYYHNLKNSWFDNSNLPAMSESGSDACSFSLDCFLPYMCALLKVRHDVLDKWNTSL